MTKGLKFLFKLSAVIGLSSSLLIAAVGSAPAADKPLKVAVVNRIQILEQSSEGQVAKGQLEREKNEKQKELDKIQEEMKKMMEELEKQGALLTEEKKREKQETLVRRERELKRLYEDFNRDLGKKEQELLGGIVLKINQVIKDYGQEKGYSVILDSTTILYWSQDVDVTADIVKRVNLIKK